MAKMTSEEFNNKYAEKITDNDDLLIELMEDFADSVTIGDNTELESLKRELEIAKADFDDLKEKYKLRFLGAIEDKINETDNEESDSESDDEGLEEEEVVDVTEI